MDNFDAIIIKKLAENADVTAAELVPFVNLSIPSINKRIEKLKSSGAIKQFSIITNAKLVGKPIVAFLFLTVDKTERLEPIKEYILSNHDILEFYSVTGTYDYILKVSLSSIENLEDLIITLKRKFGVIKSQTMITLTEHKFSPSAIPET